MNTRILLASLVVAMPVLSFADQLTVTTVNKLQIARPNQTIELSKKDLAGVSADLERIHVKDSNGKELVCQAVDTDFDALHTPDVVIFQADFAPGETKTFVVSSGGKHEFKKEDFKAFGRFNRERFDDFAWENDRIAHRTYGKALETWEGEPLSSSTIDIWSKRTPRMVINEWYMLDNYHSDAGDGADFYSAGTSRGCGGNGLWAADRLWISRNFVSSRVLANGPIRVMFELDYEPFEVNGVSVAETKRISLDAGQNLDHFQSTYKVYSLKKQALVTGIGLKKVSGEQMEAHSDRGWFVKWEKMEKNAGNQGLAIVIDPKLFEKQTEDKLNQLVLVKVPESGVVSYWAGFFWDKAGQFSDFSGWKQYVDEFAQSVASPIEVSVTSK